MTPKRILFASPPLAGHTHQLIVLGQELMARGHHVAFANTELFRERITRAGIEFLHWDQASAVKDPAVRQVLEDKSDLWMKVSQEPNIVRGEILILTVGVELYVPQYRTLEPLFKEYRPDLVIVDSAGVAPRDLALRNNVPCIVIAQFLGGLVPLSAKYPRFGTGLSLQMTPREKLWNRLYPITTLLRVAPQISRMMRYHRECTPPGGRPGVRPHLTLVCTAFGVELPRPLPSNVQMIGPMIPPRLEPLPPALQGWLEDGDKPVVYVSFGTLAMLDQRQLKNVVEGLSSDRFRVLLALRQSQQPLLPPLPGSFRLEPFVPQQAVLAHPAVVGFMSHCGMNSVSESLYWGKPLLALPIFGDQHYNAARLTDLGAGLRLDKGSFTAEEVRQKIHAVLSESRFKSTAERLSIILRAMKGLQRAADTAETVLSVGYEHLIPA